MSLFSVIPAMKNIQQIQVGEHVPVLARTAWENDVLLGIYTAVDTTQTNFMNKGRIVVQKFVRFEEKWYAVDRLWETE